MELSPSREEKQLRHCECFWDLSFICPHTAGLADASQVLGWPSRPLPRGGAVAVALMSLSSSSADPDGSHAGHLAPRSGFYPEGLPSECSGLRKEMGPTGRVN